MASEISVYACDSAEKAKSAKNFLLTGGYKEGNITVEQAEVFIYDANTFDSGANDSLADKWIVIGRRE